MAKSNPKQSTPNVLFLFFLTCSLSIWDLTESKSRFSETGSRSKKASKVSVSTTTEFPPITLDNCPAFLNEESLEIWIPHRVCYYTTWARYRPKPFNMAVEDFDPRLCTHVIIAFAWITEGKLSFHSEYDDKPIFEELVRFKHHYPHLKVLAAVGGWNFGSGPFRQIVRSEETRQIFTKSSIDFLENWDLDGLDLDWEYPEAREKKNLTALITTLRHGFDSHAQANKRNPFLLTAAVPAAKLRMGGYDIPRIKDKLDFINIMAYDLHGPWDKKTGHNAPMKSADGLSVPNGVNMWAKGGMPKRKIIVGMPTYGHSFRLAKDWTKEVGSTAWGGVAGPYTRTSGFFAYYEVCDFLADEDTELYWDRKSGVVPYAVKNNTWVKWTMDSGYGGVMVWSLALDDYTGQVCRENVTYPLLKALNEHLGCSIDNEPLPQPVLDYVLEVRNRPKPWEKTWWTTTAKPAKKKKVTKPSSSNKDMKKKKKESKANSSTDSQQPWEYETLENRLKVDDQCDWENEFRPGENCSHFVRCDRGKLHEFTCPTGLAFKPDVSICLWPWEVEGCEDMEPPVLPERTTRPPKSRKKDSTAEVDENGNSDSNDGEEVVLDVIHVEDAEGPEENDGSQASPVREIHYVSHQQSNSQILPAHNNNPTNYQHTIQQLFHDAAANATTQVISLFRGVN